MAVLEQVERREGMLRELRLRLLAPKSQDDAAALEKALRELLGWKALD